MQESVYKQRVAPRRLPPDSPNILIVLIDDAGPGLPSTLGGEVHTPTLDRVAMGGISLNRFAVSLDYYDKVPFKSNGTIEQVHVEYVTGTE